MTSYLTSSDAQELADALPGLARFKAADESAQGALLLMASIRLDASRRWQGRKYDADQEREFPRVPYGNTTVWDWNTEDEEAVVPDAVKLAVLFEADSIADGSFDRIQKKIAAGLTAQSTGSLSETYVGHSAVTASLAGRQLCPEAERLIRKYVLATGGMR